MTHLKQDLFLQVCFSCMKGTSKINNNKGVNPNGIEGWMISIVCEIYAIIFSLGNLSISIDKIASQKVPLDVS